jgi:N6-adenosine-specific RNA methylase IME4
MKKFNLILADPPWKYGNTSSRGAADNHYDTMTIAEMKLLPVSKIFADDAILAMWYTGNFNKEAMDLAKAWGFEVKTMKGLTWVKLTVGRNPYQ